jgi:hypothetical protein
LSLLLAPPFKNSILPNQTVSDKGRIEKTTLNQYRITNTWALNIPNLLKNKKGEIANTISPFLNNADSN